MIFQTPPLFSLIFFACFVFPVVVGRIQYTDVHNNNCEVDEKDDCNSEIRKQLRIKAFIKELIKNHLRNCYIIQLGHNNLGFSQRLRMIPTLDVGLDNTSTNTIFEYFNTNSAETLIRFQEQCIIFYVILLKDDLDNSEKDLNHLTRIFQNPKLLAQAHQSYIFINDFEIEDTNHDTAKSFLLHPALRQYEHKTWIEAKHEEVNNNYVSSSRYELQRKFKTTFQINNFCYFCMGGSAGIKANPKQFAHGKQFRNVHDIFPDVTSNLFGKAMKVTAAMALPFVGILPSLSDPKKLRVEGMQGTILKAIAKTLNFTIVLENTSKGLTGSKLSNDTWTGTIGEVFYGRADIGLNAATSSDRHEIVDFTVSAFYGFLVLVSTKPSPFFEWKAIVYPFEILSWIGICASTGITVLAYRFFLNKAVVREEIKEPRKRDVSYLKVCYITIGTLLEQGIPFNYRTTPSKVYATFWWMFILVSTCAYKSKLFSYLTFPTIKTPPSTFHELATSDYTWGIKSLGGVALLFITKSPVSYIRRVGESMEISMDKYSCLDKTFSPKFTCIIYKAYYDYMSAVRYWKLAHKFYVSDYVTPPVGSSWVLPKYSPLLHPLDKLTFAQFEMGLSGIYLEHYIKTMALRSRALAQASKDVNDLFQMNTKFKRETIIEKPLQFANVYAGFLILFFGTWISAAALIAETIRYRHATHAKERKEVMKQVRRLRLQGLHLLRSNPKKRKVQFGTATILQPPLEIK